MKKTIIYSKVNFTELEKEILEALQKYGYKDILESYKSLDPDIDLQGIVTGFLNAFLEETSKDSILTLDTQLLRVFKVKEGEVELTISNDLKDLFPKVIKSIDLDQEFYLGKIQDPKDRKLLENYVTSIDGNVYALKNLPEEVIAVIMAYVSRSPNTFKENLLTSLKDEDIIADNVSSALDKTSDKAQKFHEKWVLAYGHSCYDKETEVLTDKGWMYWKDVVTFDPSTIKLATLNPSNFNLEYYNPIKFINTFYAGQMYGIKTKYLNLLVTPNHKNFVKVGRSKDAKHTLVQVARLKGKYQEYLLNSNWLGNVSTKIQVGNLSLDTNTFFKLVGFFIGDGHLDFKYNSSIQFHLKKERKISYLKSLCKDLGLELLEHANNRFYVKGDFLKWFSKCYTPNLEKQIPRDLLEYSTTALNCLLEGLINSDGNVSKTSGSLTYSTTSETLKNCVYELALKTGLLCSTSYVRRSTDTCKTCYVLCIQKIFKKYEVNRTLSTIQDFYTEYKDFVYCAQMPKNHILCVRRNGLVMFSGNSCAELAHVSICMDDVSILASKQIEDNRLASYCEKSTRYQKFESNHAYHIPDELKDDHIRMYCDLMDYTFMMYNNLFTPVKKELKVLYPKADKVSEKAYENSIHAKACDILRYLLPTSTYTSLALKFNGRTAAQAISKLKSHSLKESQEIGMLLKNEAIKVLPTLVKYADKNEFRIGLPLLRSKFTQGLKLPTNNINCSKIVSTSVDYQGLLNTLVTNILYPESNVSFEDLKTFVKMDLSQNYKKSLILEYVNSRGKFDSLPRVFETINLQVEMLSDYGAYRDLQRHRLCTPIDTLLSPELGFSLHPDTERLSFDIQQSIANVLIYQKHLYQDFIDAGVSKEVCQYLLSMAWNIKYSRVYNLRDLVNMLELRSGKQGHVSYRKISLDIGKDLISKFPIMQDILRLDETPLTSLERIESEAKHNK